MNAIFYVQKAQPLTEANIISHNHEIDLGLYLDKLMKKV